MNRRVAAFFRSNWDRILVGGVWIFFFLGVPLAAWEGDSAWYYMNYRYLLTGTYRHNVGLQLFEGPVLYHSPLGYPLVIAAARGLSALTGGAAGWTTCLQLLQGVFYVGAYEACRRLYELLSGGKRSYCMVGEADSVRNGSAVGDLAERAATAESARRSRRAAGGHRARHATAQSGRRPRAAISIPF